MKITIFMIGLLITALYTGASIGIGDTGTTTKEIIVPPYERDYMVLDQESLKLLDEQWNNTPVLNSTQSSLKIKTYISPSYSSSDFSILNSIPYIPWERNQGSSGNCWIWAGTAALEGSHTYYNGYKDRLSIQLVDSGYPEWTSCSGGWPSYFASFYNSVGYAVPWNNSNAFYHDRSLSSCAGTSVSFDSIGKSPSYQINRNMVAYKIQGTDNDYISQIKAELRMYNPVILCYFAPNENAWQNYFEREWYNGLSTNILDFSREWGGSEDAGDEVGHATVIVGYHDDPYDPAKSYWIVLNSWGTTNSHPDGTFRLSMHPSKGYNADFDREGWFTGDEIVTRFFVYTYNNNKQAFVQEPAKPVSLKVESLIPNSTTGQTRVVFKTTDWGYPSQYELSINKKVISGNYYPQNKLLDHNIYVDLEPGTYNPSYRSKNGIGGFSGSIYLDQPLIIKSYDPEPKFYWRNPSYCPIIEAAPSPESPVSVQFTDTSAYGVNKWQWDFGDGNTSNEQNPRHIYSYPGNYTVKLTVWNKWGGPRTLNQVVNAFWSKDCSDLFNIHIDLIRPYYPPWSIWEITIPVEDLYERTINIQTEISPAKIVYTPAGTLQKNILAGVDEQFYFQKPILEDSAYVKPALTSVDNSFAVKTKKLETKAISARNIYMPAKIAINNTSTNVNYSSIKANDSLYYQGTIFADSRYNRTTLGPLLYNTKVLTPILQIKPKEKVESKFSVNTSGLYPGEYQVVVTFRDSSTNEIIYQGPVYFNVLEIPNIQVTPAALDFGTLNIGQENHKEVTISNTGNVNLSYNITIPQDCTASSLEGTVPAFKSQTISLSVDTIYAAQVQSSGERSVVIRSNSSTNETINIPVTYILNAPCASLVEMNAPTTLNAGETYILNVTMHNEGSIPWDNTYTLGVPTVGDASKFVSTDANTVSRVNPGENATYQLTLQAPSATGNYMLAFEMYYMDSNNVKRFFGWPVFLGITVRS